MLPQGDLFGGAPEHWSVLKQLPSCLMIGLQHVVGILLPLECFGRVSNDTSVKVTKRPYLFLIQHTT